MTTLYKQVPSHGAITRERAIEIARERWPHAWSSGETETAGIQWSGDFGSHPTAEWSEIVTGKWQTCHDCGNRLSSSYGADICDVCAEFNNGPNKHVLPYQTIS